MGRTRVPTSCSSLSLASRLAFRSLSHSGSDYPAPKTRRGTGTDFSDLNEVAFVAVPVNSRQAFTKVDHNIAQRPLIRPIRGHIDVVRQMSSRPYRKTLRRHLNGTLASNLLVQERGRTHRLLPLRRCRRVTLKRGSRLVLFNRHLSPQFLRKTLRERNRELPRSQFRFLKDRLSLSRREDI